MRREGFICLVAGFTLLVAGCPGPRFPPTDGGMGDSALPIGECNDGIDNDGDNRIDFPFDPGCSAPTDPDEIDPPVPPECADGMDNDGDMLIDFPLDPGCVAAGDNMEMDPEQCGDMIDNDGDGFIDFPDDLGCTSLFDDDETNPQCSNGIDDDGDMLIDFPDDPDCGSATEDDEQGVAECGDGVDNDGDALVDWPVDPGCISDVDDDEFNPPICAGGVFVTDITASGTNAGVVTGTSNYMGSCGGSTAPDAVFWVNPPVDLESMSITATGTGFTPLLYVQTFCGDMTSEIACANNSINLSNVNAGGYFIFLDGTSGSGGAYTIDVSGIIAGGQPCDPASTVFVCNTANGFACMDLGGGPICVAGQCSDGMDNDGDGAVDYPLDPGCDDFADNDETDPAVAPQCADGLDNDGDSLTDYPMDFGCTAASDDDESGCLFALISQETQFSDNTTITGMLTANGHSFTIYDNNGSTGVHTSNMALLNMYNTIIFHEHDRVLGTTEATNLTAWVNAGGRLLVTGYDSLGSPTDSVLAGVVNCIGPGDGPFSGTLSVVNGTHPIMLGPAQAFPLGTALTAASTDHDQCSPGAGAIQLVTVGGTSSKLLVTDNVGGGTGKVLYWNGNGSTSGPLVDWLGTGGTQPDLQNLFVNVINHMCAP